jgi:hypothetical protein
MPTQREDRHFEAYRDVPPEFVSASSTPKALPVSAFERVFGARRSGRDCDPVPRMCRQISPNQRKGCHSSRT